MIIIFISVMALHVDVAVTDGLIPILTSHHRVSMRRVCERLKGEFIRDGVFVCIFRLDWLNCGESHAHASGEYLVSKLVLVLVWWGCHMDMHPGVFWERWGVPDARKVKVKGRRVGKKHMEGYGRETKRREGEKESHRRCEASIPIPILTDVERQTTNANL